MDEIRCFRCGRVRCATCRGRGFLAPDLMLQGGYCPDCEDGWREAALQSEPAQAGDIVEDGFHRWLLTQGRKAYQLGMKPEVLCPKCEEKKDVS